MKQVLEKKKLNSIAEDERKKRSRNNIILLKRIFSNLLREPNHQTLPLKERHSKSITLY